MQSIWPSTVNVLRGRPWFTSGFRAPCRYALQCSCFSTTAVLRQGTAAAVRKERVTSFAENLISTAVRSTSVQPSPLSLDEIQGHSESENSLSEEHARHTAPQLSRAAARAVRLSTQQQGLQTAYLLIKSLQESMKQYKPGLMPDLYALQRVAIDFGQAVSPRLSMHCLLHGLIRRGMTVKASRFAHDMIRAGVEVNERTMQALTSALCHTDIAAIRDEEYRAQLQSARTKAHHTQEDTPSKPPHINSGSVQSRSTRLALQLFFAAKQYQKQRARQMFQQLIDACLLQGEIIVVSFLFAFLVKQWQLRRAQAGEPSDSRGEKPPDFDTWPLTSKELSAKGQDAFLPGPDVLQRTLQHIDAAIFNSVPPEPHTLLPSLEEAAQALAFIAGLLDNYVLPYPQLSKLISLLIAFPEEPSVRVWTRRNNTWLYKFAREYFDEVLEGLVNSLPLPEVQNHNRKDRQLLDRYSYNSLLHYALRYKSSPALGSKILNHMAALGGSNSPDITTFNIILRSGTLLERADLTTQTLQLLRQRQENSDVEDILGIPVTSINEQNTETSEPHILESFKNEKFDVIDPSSLPAETFLEVDAYTLTTYLMHLTSSGRPDIVASLLFRFLPELHIVDHPALTEEGRQQRRELNRLNRRKCLERAVALGPHFFVAVLNALRKAGKTGLAERVWILAKQAEALSWDADFTQGSVQPWCLPISAYTVMMQCYAAEGRKGFRPLSGRFNDPSVEWRPRHKGGVTGWARFVLIAQEMTHDKRRKALSSTTLSQLERRSAARELGIQLLHAMRSGGRIVYEQLASIGQNEAGRVGLKGVRPPVPDARFFNAALELFGRLPGQHARETCVSPREWRRLHRRAHERFMKFGRSGVANIDPYLEEVLWAMHDAGFEIPLTFRRLLVGRRIPPPRRIPNSVEPAPLPFRHMAKSRTPVHRIRTNKHRGLPVRRLKGNRLATINKPHPHVSDV